MLFKSKFHQGIVRGHIRATVRAWRSPRVLPGKRYRVHGAGTIEIEAIEPIRVSEIGANDAAASGFDSVEELLAMLAKDARRRLTGRSRVYRVRFRYVGRESEPVRAPADVASKLARIDSSSRGGPWTMRVLRLIRENPGVSAAELARRLGREKLPFKADVRKLKNLGLTKSFAVGYGLSSLGESLLIAPAGSLGRGRPKPPSPPSRRSPRTGSSI